MKAPDSAGASETWEGCWSDEECGELPKLDVVKRVVTPPSLQLSPSIDLLHWLDMK